MKFHVLCTDGFATAGIEALKKSRLIEPTYVKSLTHEDLLKTIGGFDGLIVRSASQVTKDIVEAGKKLKIIARAGVGIDNIDVEAATKQGILVINAPAGNTVSAAELTMGMILSLARRIPQAAKAMSEGRWEKKKFQGSELAGKTLGIIGLGRIGREVARRAASFNMQLIGFDPFLGKEQFASLGVLPSTKEDIYKNADYITVHTPLTDDTCNMITMRELKTMKKPACVINCARGGIINEQDLAQALANGVIAGAALDVFSREPFEDALFRKLENCITTPHLGASTAEAQDAVAVESAREVVQFFKEGFSANAVNLPAGDPQAIFSLRNHILLAERLGSFAFQLCRQEVKKVTFISTKRLPELVTLAALKGVLSNIVSDAISLVNASIVANQRGIKISEEVEASDYEDAIGVRISSSERNIEITGTIFSDGTQQIVRCDGYNVTMEPFGRILFIKNADQPGVIGRICSILGDNKINISEMKNARKTKGTDALTVISFDNELPKKVMQKIKDEKGVNDAIEIRLPF
ncbi:MAG: phosphoglycerate dehydrogenase [Deltaproteobacteria bacterium]|nr:phosphoglycerate dehydrogenase [Deltaproteobacteria bacterium]